MCASPPATPFGLPNQCDAFYSPRELPGDVEMARAAIELLLLTILSATAVAQADKCVALVIGNSGYQHAPKLINPKNDATDIAARQATLPAVQIGILFAIYGGPPARGNHFVFG